MSNLFDGLLVLDFTNNVAGPTATAMMADFGATVIKIERPIHGDDNRSYSPFVEGKSISGMWYNRGKKSVVLDAKHPKSLKILTELAQKADVVVESFRPGVIARLGLGYEDISKINPQVIMCSVSAFGQTGPYSQKAGYDLIAQALSGLMEMTGFPDGGPVRIGTAIGDSCGAFNAFGAISAALYHRERTGKGQYIDIALLDCLMATIDSAESTFNDFEVTRSGNMHMMIAPFGLFKGNDGSIIIGTVGQNLWAKLCFLIEREDLIEDPAFSSAGKRVLVLDRIVPIIEDWLKTFPTVDEARKVLDEAGIPCAKLNTVSDLLTDPQIQAREMITDIDTPEISTGKIKGRGMHLKFSATRANMGPAPIFGEHTEYVLRELLGYDDSLIAEFAQDKVFGPVQTELVDG